MQLSPKHPNPKLAIQAPTRGHSVVLLLVVVGWTNVGKVLQEIKQSAAQTGPQGTL